MVLFSEKSKVRLNGKTVIVTGSNTGIGKETVVDMYKRGAHVIMACRNVDKAEKAAKDIQDSCKELTDVGKLTVVELDLSSLKSVRECSAKILAKEERIDILVNNAGIMCVPYSKTEDGFESQFGTNHLGHFLLTLLLLPKIIKSTPARIVNVSSTLHEGNRIDFNDINWEKKKYSPIGGYQQTKLCNILFTNELALRLKEANINGVTVYSLHPGVVETEIGRHLDDTYFKGGKWVLATVGKLFGKTPTEGAQTTIYCAIDETAGTQTGLYYANCKTKKPSSAARNTDDAKKLWDVSIEMTNLLEYNPFEK